MRTKTKRQVFHVVYNPSERTWDIKRERGARQILVDALFFKYSALSRGARICRDIKANGGLAQLIIHYKNGRIENERTYGADPVRYKG